MPEFIAFAGKLLFKYINIGKINYYKEKKLLERNTPAIGIISSKEDNPNNWIASGRYFEQIALLATSLGIRVAPMAAAIEMSSKREEIKRRLQNQYYPQIIFRIGRSKSKILKSPRLDVNQVVI